jgi:ferredoxin, 2Fe-2S
MPKLTVIEFNGAAHALDVTEGSSVMRAAVDALIPGILADCGGSCSCATCHCYIDPDWLERVPPAGADELELLENALGVNERSRLSCQVRVDTALDGLVVHLPKSQL